MTCEKTEYLILYKLGGRGIGQVHLSKGESKGPNLQRSHKGKEGMKNILVNV